MTVNQTGEKLFKYTLSVMRHNHVRPQETTIIQSTAFKGKTPPKNKKFPVRIIVRGEQEKEWLNDEPILGWITCQGMISRSHCKILEHDSFHGHVTENIIKYFQEEKMDLVIIQFRMTFLLQPVDICIICLFKWHMNIIYTQLTTMKHTNRQTEKPGLIQICE
jgi:hypothetical protein